MTGSSRTEVGLVLVVYVLPLLLVSGLLALAGLGVLAVALLAVEAAVAGATLAVRRRGRGGAAAPARRPWAVPLAMVAVVAGVVGLAAYAARLG